MSVCVPVRDMKNTSTFTDLVQLEGDVTVTKNGYDTMHCLSIEEYSALKEEASKASLLSRIVLAEAEIAEGKHSDYRESKLRTEDVGFTQEEMAWILDYVRFSGIDLADIVREAVLERVEDAADIEAYNAALLEKDDGVRYTTDEVMDMALMAE